MRLRNEIKKKKDIEDKEKDEKTSRSNAEDACTRGNELNMDWVTNASDDGQRHSYKYDLKQMIPKVTKRVVSAVDVTLARFVERLVPLEISVSRILENRIAASERGSQTDSAQGKTGEKEESGGSCRPLPLPPPLYNKETQIERVKKQTASTDLSAYEVREKRVPPQNNEQAGKSIPSRTREPNARSEN